MNVFFVLFFSTTLWLSEKDARECCGETKVERGRCCTAGSAQQQRMVWLVEITKKGAAEYRELIDQTTLLQSQKGMTIEQIRSKIYFVVT